MFLRKTSRSEDGKIHNYWSVAENARTGRRVVRIARGEAEPPKAVARGVRQRKGIAAAKERGVKFGRPKRQLPREFQSIAVDFRNGALTLIRAAAQCHMPPTTFWRKSKMTPPQLPNT